MKNCPTNSTIGLSDLRFPLSAFRSQVSGFLKAFTPSAPIALLALLALLAAAPSGNGAVIVKANNTSALNLTTSWTNSVVPGFADVATWTNTVTGANSDLLGADLSWLGIRIFNPGGLVTIGAGNTLTLGKSGIDMSAATADLTINSGLTLGVGGQTWNVATGRTLTLNPSTFTRTGDATLNIQGAGTVATTTIANVNGIVGPWASFGTGVSTKYATANGTAIVGLTGTAAATGANVTSTAGTVNYDVAATSGTFGAGASVNTLRIAGTTGTIAGDLTANGMMLTLSALTNVATLSGNITIGSTRELVVTGGQGGLTMSGIIRDNGAGASKVVITGTYGNIIFSGNNTFSGGLTINNLVVTYNLYFNSAAALGTGTMQIKGGTAAGNPGIFYFGTSTNAGAMDVYNNTINFDTPRGGSTQINLNMNTAATSQGFQINEITGIFGDHTPSLTANGKTIRILNGVSATGVNGNGIRLFAVTNSISTSPSTYEFGGGTSNSILSVGQGALLNWGSVNALFSGNTTQTGLVNFGGAGNAVNTFGIINAGGNSTFSGANNIIGASISGFVNYVAKDSASRMTISGAINDANTYGSAVGLQINNSYTDNINGVNTPTGTVVLSGLNVFRGSSTIYAGTLAVGNAKALGWGGLQSNTIGTTTVASGATLDINGTASVIEPIILNGTGIGGNGALVNNSGTLASIANGISGIQLSGTTTGSGYSVAPTVAFANAGGGTGAAATASLGLTTASITAISNGGTSGWAVGDTLSVTGGSGTGAIATVTSVSSGVITALSITTAGNNYTGAPTTLTKLTGAGVGTPMITGNAVNFTISGVTMTAQGTGYTGTPTYTFSAGNAIPGSVILSSVTLASDSSIGGTGNLTINTVVSESGGARALTKVGAGTLTLSGTNTYTGNTTVNGGTLVAGNARALGSTSAGLTITSGTVDLGSFSLAKSDFTMSGGSLTNGTLTANLYNLNGGTLYSALGNGAITVGGTTTLGPTGRFNVGSSLNIASAGVLNLGGNETVNTFTNSGGILAGTGRTLTALSYDLNGGTVSANLGTGTINVGASSTLSGTAAATTVNVTTGTFSLGGNERLASGASVAVNSTLDLGGFSQTLGGLTGSGNVTNSIGGSLTLNVGSGNNNFAGSITGAGGLTKSGAGAVTLNGAQTFTGKTTVSAGTLILAAGATLNSTEINLGTSGGQGTLTANSGLTIRAGQTLAGYGTVNGNTVIDGYLAPGNSPGILTFKNDLTLSSSSTSTFEVKGLSGAGVLTGFDQVKVAGNLIYGGILKLDITAINGNYTMSNPFSGLLFDVTGTKTGFFDKVQYSLNGSTYADLKWYVNNTTWQMWDPTAIAAGAANGYVGINLTSGVLTVVPEPSTWALVIGGVSTLVILRRRKQS